jgi:hypothetical protein
VLRDKGSRSTTLSERFRDLAHSGSRCFAKLPTAFPVGACYVEHVSNESAGDRPMTTHSVPGRHLAVYRTLRGEKAIVVEAQDMTEACRIAHAELIRLPDALGLKGVFLDEPTEALSA